MNPTLSAWKTTTALSLVEKIPLQTFESALIFVEDYLSVVGGWNPDDPTNPTGPGLPLSGATPDEAVVAIVDERYDHIYVIDGTATVNVKFQYTANLPSGQTSNAVLTALETRIKAFIEEQINRSLMETDVVESISGTVTVEGVTTTENRVSINDDALAGDTDANPAAAALVFARNQYGLDETWNVSNMYTEDDEPYVYQIRKYTSNSYTTLDSNSIDYYVLNVNPSTNRIISGVHFIQ